MCRTYLTLCYSEYAELCQSFGIERMSMMLSMLCRFLFISFVLSGIGHFVTDRGRRVTKVCFFRYYLFTFAVFGVWLKPSANAYKLYEEEYFRTNYSDVQFYHLDPGIL